jgi:hypothetical protein
VGPGVAPYLVYFFASKIEGRVGKQVIEAQCELLFSTCIAPDLSR